MWARLCVGRLTFGLFTPLAKAAGPLPEYRQSGEHAARGGDAADRHVDRDPALLGPVDVLQVQQQRELVHDESEPDTVGDRGRGVPVQLLVAADRDPSYAGQHSDAPHVMVQVLAAEAQVPERPLAGPDRVRDSPDPAPCPGERQPRDKRRLLAGVQFAVISVAKLRDYRLLRHFANDTPIASG